MFSELTADLLQPPPSVGGNKPGLRGCKQRLAEAGKAGVSALHQEDWWWEASCGLGWVW